MLLLNLFAQHVAESLLKEFPSSERHSRLSLFIKGNFLDWSQNDKGLTTKAT